MWGQGKKATSTKIGTLIGRDTEITGDVRFSGGLHIDGSVKGNVMGTGDDAVLMVSEHGRIEGEVRVHNVILNGAVSGDVHASGRIELAPQAKVNGNVYYSLIEMAMGAAVNGSLVNQAAAAAVSGVESRKPGAEGTPANIIQGNS